MTTWPQYSPRDPARVTTSCHVTARLYIVHVLLNFSHVEIYLLHMTSWRICVVYYVERGALIAHNSAALSIFSVIKYGATLYKMNIHQYIVSCIYSVRTCFMKLETWDCCTWALYLYIIPSYHDNLIYLLFY